MEREPDQPTREQQAEDDATNEGMTDRRRQERARGPLVRPRKPAAPRRTRATRQASSSPVTAAG